MIVDQNIGFCKGCIPKFDQNNIVCSICMTHYLNETSAVQYFSLNPMYRYLIFGFKSCEYLIIVNVCITQSTLTEMTFKTNMNRKRILVMTIPYSSHNVGCYKLILDAWTKIGEIAIAVLILLKHNKTKYDLLLLPWLFYILVHAWIFVVKPLHIYS